MWRNVEFVVPSFLRSPPTPAWASPPHPNSYPSLWPKVSPSSGTAANSHPGLWPKVPVATLPGLWPKCHHPLWGNLGCPISPQADSCPSAGMHVAAASGAGLLPSSLMEPGMSLLARHKAWCIVRPNSPAKHNPRTCNVLACRPFRFCTSAATCCGFGVDEWASGPARRLGQNCG